MIGLIAYHNLHKIIRFGKYNVKIYLYVLHLGLEHHKMKKKVSKQEFRSAFYNVQNVSCQEGSKYYISNLKKDNKKVLTKVLTIFLLYILSILHL